MSGPEDFVLPRIRAMHGYVPGLQLNDPEIIKLNTNENPFPISPAVRAAIAAALEQDQLHLYPEPASRALRSAIAAHHGLPENHALVGNGSDEVLSILFRGVLDAGDSIVTATPTYSLYPTLAAMLGARVEAVQVREDWQMDLPLMQQLMQRGATADENADRRPLAIITNPNAPTGLVESREAVLTFAKDNPALTLVDEAYADFGAHSIAGMAGTAEYARLLVCGTFSKTYSLAGGRVGWLLAHPRMIVELDKIRDSYNINRLTQAAALAALLDQGELARRIEIIIANRAYLTAELTRLGFFSLPGQANFVFTQPPERLRQSPGLRLPGSDPSTSLGHLYYEHLKAHKILVRHFPGPRTEDFVRITIGTREQMERLVQVTAQSLG